MLTKEKILNTIKNGGEYNCYGLRYDNNSYNVGDDCKNSSQWMQDAYNVDNYQDLTSDELYALYCYELGCFAAYELKGTIVIEVTEDNIDEAMEIVEKYAYDGANLILVAGYWGMMSDYDECIIENATVVAK